MGNDRRIRVFRGSGSEAPILTYNPSKENVYFVPPGWHLGGYDTEDIAGLEELGVELQWILLNKKPMEEIPGILKSFGVPEEELQGFMRNEDMARKGLKFQERLGGDIEPFD